MSANKHLKSEKIRQLKEKIAQNEAAIARILSHSDALKFSHTTDPFFESYFNGNFSLS